MELTLAIGFLVAAVSFAAEYVDSSLGMGYGTTLTPVLLLIGFAPLEVVPALLVSQLLAGLFSGFVHHSMGNVDLKPRSFSLPVMWRDLRRFGVKESFRRGLPRGLQVALVIAVASVLGTVAAVFLAVNLPEKVLRIYVAALVLAIGIVILVTIKVHLAFSWKRIVGLGMLAAFNKGLSGGGYGPLVTGGQVLSGVPVRDAGGHHFGGRGVHLPRGCHHLRLPVRGGVAPGPLSGGRGAAFGPAHRMDGAGPAPPVAAGGHRGHHHRPGQRHDHRDALSGSGREPPSSTPSTGGRACECGAGSCRRGRGSGVPS